MSPSAPAYIAAPSGLKVPSSDLNYGIPRESNNGPAGDIDLVIREEDATAILEVLAKSGYEGVAMERSWLFLVGLEIVGDKLVEVNVQSSGGLFSIERFTGVDFAPMIVQRMEEHVSRTSDHRDGRGSSDA